MFEIPTKVGNLVGGTTKISNTCASNITKVLKVATICDAFNTSDDLRVLWELDQLGIKSPEVDSNVALDKFKKSIDFAGGRYTASLPWRDDCPTLAINRTLSLNRLISLLQSLKKKSEILKLYDDLIHEQEKLGFIEKVDEGTLLIKVRYIICLTSS